MAWLRGLLLITLFGACTHGRIRPGGLGLRVWVLRHETLLSVFTLQIHMFAWRLNGVRVLVLPASRKSFVTAKHSLQILTGLWQELLTWQQEFLSFLFEHFYCIINDSACDSDTHIPSIDHLLDFAKIFDLQFCKLFNQDCGLVVILKLWVNIIPELDSIRPLVLFLRIHHDRVPVFISYQLNWLESWCWTLLICTLLLNFGQIFLILRPKVIR